MMAAVDADIDKGMVARVRRVAHVRDLPRAYVNDGFAGRLPRMSSDEDEMLDATASERRPTVASSCQIELSDELDGLVVGSNFQICMSATSSAAPIAPPRSPSAASRTSGGRASTNRWGCIAAAIRAT